MRILLVFLPFLGIMLPRYAYCVSSIAENKIRRQKAEDYRAEDR